MTWGFGKSKTVDWSAERNKQISCLLQAFPRATQVTTGLSAGTQGLDISIPNASPSALLRITLPSRFPEVAPMLKVFGLRVTHPYFDAQMSVSNMNELNIWSQSSHSQVPHGDKLSDVVKKVIAEVERSVYNPSQQRQQQHAVSGLYGGRPYVPGQPIHYSGVGDINNHRYLSNAGIQNQNISQQSQFVPPQPLSYEQQQTPNNYYQNPPSSNQQVVSYHTIPSYQETQNRQSSPPPSSLRNPPKKTKAELEKECLDIKMRNFLETHKLEVPTKFDEVENLAISRLELLDKDANSEFEIFFMEYSEKKKFSQIVEVAQNENGNTADKNLKLNDEYLALVRDVKDLKQQLETEKQKIEQKLSENVKVLDSETLKSTVRQEANRIEQSTDNLADMVEDGKITPSDFVEQFVKERTNYHRYKAQLEHISP